jgi:hypothetical protein
MLNKVTTLIVLAVILGAGGYVAKLKWDNAQLRRERNELALEKMNVEAAADSTLRVVYDSLATATRLAVQRGITLDSLARLSGMEEVAAESHLVATVDTATGADTGTVVSPASAHFDIRSRPFTLTLDVSIPPDATPTIDYAVALDPAPLRVRVGCGGGEISLPDATRARVTVTGPVWLDVDIAEATFDPMVCNRRLMEPEDARTIIDQITMPFVGAIVGAGTAAVYGDAEDIGANLLSGALLGAATGFLVDQVLR